MAATEISRWRAQWKQAQDERGTHHHSLVLPVRRLSDIILYVAAPLALFRGTQMWPGWPTVQSEFVPGFILHQSAQLYLLLALSLLYVVLNIREFMDAVAKSTLLFRIFMVFVALSVFLSIDLRDSIFNLASVLSMGLPMALFYWRFGPERSLEMFRVFSIGTILISALYVVLQPQYAFMGGSLEGDMRGLFPHKNGFGPFMAVACIALMPSPAQAPLYHRAQLVRLFSAAAAAAFTILSNSSTSWVLLMVGIATMLSATVIRAQHHRGIRRTLTVLLFLLVVALVYFGGMLLASNIAEAAGKDMTFSGRSYIWAALWPHLFDNPVTGYGFGVMRHAEYIEPLLRDVPFSVNSPHNTYIELILNIGFFGGLAWIAFLLVRLMTKIVLRSGDHYTDGVRNRECAIIVMIIIASLTEAGRMLAPTVTWPLLAMALPMWTMGSAEDTDSPTEDEEPDVQRRRPRGADGAVSALIREGNDRARRHSR